MNGQAWGTLLTGAAAIAAVAVTWKRDRKRSREQLKNVDTNRRRDLQAFVSAQTETLLQGYQGVFDEYKKQAEALVKERADLLRRVGTLEVSHADCQHRCEALTVEVQSLKRTVAELSEQRA